MKRILFALCAVVALSLPILGQDASTQMQTSATCCVVRVHDFQLNPGGDSARVVVRWVRSDGSISEERAWGVTDGEPETVADNFLWGTGTAGQPFGLMRRYLAAASEETGTLKARANKAVLRWLQTTARIGASEITIP